VFVAERSRGMLEYAMAKAALRRDESGVGSASRHGRSASASARFGHRSKPAIAGRSLAGGCAGDAVMAAQGRNRARDSRPSRDSFGRI